MQKKKKSEKVQLPKKFPYKPLMLHLKKKKKKASGAFGAGLKMSKKKCNFSPFGLPFPPTKLHQDAKKCKKMQLLAKTENAKKCKKCKLHFFPFPA